MNLITSQYHLDLTEYHCSPNWYENNIKKYIMEIKTDIPWKNQEEIDIKV